ncbi:MAG: amino acid adenylation domain-containing protein, partial [Saprospiraceae bacterium]
LSLGLQSEQFVAICMDRSFEMLISIFAVLKAGGAYVPIDVDYPEERLRFMIEDSAAQIVLTQRSLVEKLPKTAKHIIPLEELNLEQSTVNSPELSKDTRPTTNYQLPTTNPNHLAYCIYTSGSTGKPKGVMITHENLVYQLQGQHAIAPAPIGKMILTCSISFDVSVLTIFWTLLSGAPLLIPEQGEEKDINRLLQLIEKEQVTHILTLPSLHTLIVEHATSQQLKSVKLVNVSGEVCPTSLTQKHAQICPNGQLYNLYGPTEATINCTYFTIPAGYDESKVPIGKTIENYEIFILNEHLKEVPNGEVGEIYIGGSHPVVGRGYWNRPKLSAERFIQNPFVTERGGATLYKTGDLARWQSDGNIEFLGRADYQVKFRGYRIELGEIETAISNHPQVKETVVLLKNPHDYGQQKLVAYVTGAQVSNMCNAKEEQQSQGDNPQAENRSRSVSDLCDDARAASPTGALTVTDLRDFLAETLPEYMLPSQFVFLEKMPLTTNGKFDRKALPEPPQERPILAQAYAAPQGKLEQYLTTIWEGLLQLSPIGRHDKFFELGGNSIQAAQFIGRLSKTLDTSIFVTTIFDKPTVAAYAQMLQSNYANELQSLFKRETSPTSNIQHPISQQNRPPSTVHRLPSKLTKFEIENFQKYIPKIPKYATLEPSTVHRSPSTVKNKPAIFILAPPRSGTTLLRVMLAGHPDLFAANELQLLGFNDLKERSEAYQGKFRLWSEGLIRAVMELQNMTADEAKDLIHRYEKAGYTTKEVYRQIQDWIGDLILVDKSPSYALDPEVLQKAEVDFDNALYIHLVRHPYTMVNSLEKYHLDQVLYLESHDYPARELGELVWLHSHRNIVQFLKNIPVHRQFRLRYEDLVSEPERVMDELCQTLGLPFHEGLLTPYADLSNKMMDGIYADSRSMGDTNLLKQKTINAAKEEQWKQVFKDNFLSDESWDWTEYFDYVGDAKKGDGKYGDNAFFTPPPIDKVYAKNSNSLNVNGLEKSKAVNPPIAIVGMACRLPGANTLEEFWDNLVNGVDVSQPIAPEDLEKVGLDIEKFKHKNWVRRRLMLDDPDHFDAAFFGYSPQEAKLMDPQQRVFLETAYHALENAGYDPYTYAGRIGIFGGVARNAYFTNNVATDPNRLASAGEYLDMLGYEKNFSVTRVAYKLNLRGPAVNVQTACSSTGVGVHLACQSIWQGDSDLVLVGGGRIQPDLQAGYEYTEGGPLSPDGYLRAFDANAQGMVRGNGMVFMVLKPLDQAVNDCDHIWATIKSTAINNDGADKIGFTAPSVSGQSTAILQAQQKAGISAAEIDYIEAHGTGTLLGDPIEMQGLTEAFRQTTDKRQFCAIGSVKTNIGHLDAGACVAGMMKVALAMKYEILPANLNFNQPNPQIDFKNSPFYVNATLQPWLRNGHIRRAGVSSFGLGGTNAHVILEEAPILKSLTRERRDDTKLFSLSAKTETALAKMEQNLLTYLDEHPLDSRTN